MVAALEHGTRTAGFQGRRQRSQSERRGFQIVGAFAVAVVAFAAVQGIAVVGAALAALLLIGSALVAAGGEPLAIRSAAAMGSIHLLAVALLTLA